MGEARQRLKRVRDKAEANGVDPATVKSITPPDLKLRPGRRIQLVTEEGVVVVQIMLHVFMPDGTQLVEQNSDGQELPLEVPCMPVPIGRTVIMPTPGPRIMR